jgi:hypothetical protein
VIDLDAAEARNTAALAQIGQLPATQATLDAVVSLRDTPDLLAELRAARAVVEMFHALPRDDSELGRRLAAYDQAVGS